MVNVFNIIVCMTVLLTSISTSMRYECMYNKGVWISQTSGDTEIQCSLDKSDLWGHWNTV